MPAGVAWRGRQMASIRPPRPALKSTYSERVRRGARKSTRKVRPLATKPALHQNRPVLSVHCAFAAALDPPSEADANCKFSPITPNSCHGWQRRLASTTVGHSPTDRCRGWQPSLPFYTTRGSLEGVLDVRGTAAPGGSAAREWCSKRRSVFAGRKWRRLGPKRTPQQGGQGPLHWNGPCLAHFDCPAP